MNNFIALFITFLRKVSYYLLLILGLAIVLWIIWMRFLRTRVPREIPFHLSEISFYLILWSCFIYLLILKSLLLPRETNWFIKLLVDLLYKPLTTLDEAVKSNHYVKEKYNKIVDRVIIRLDQIRYVDMEIIYIFYTIMPRFFLVTVLSYDVFLASRLEFIYCFILLGMFSLIRRYVKYTIKKEKEQRIKELTDIYKSVELEDVNRYNQDWEYNADTMPYHGKMLTIEEYIDFKFEDSYNFDDDKTEYDIFICVQDRTYKQYRLDKYNGVNVKLTSEDYALIKKKFHDTIPKILTLELAIKQYYWVDDEDYIKYTKVFIYSIYFICWSYILLVSYDRNLSFPLTYKIIWWLMPYIERTEPFSGIIL